MNSLPEEIYEMVSSHLSHNRDLCAFAQVSKEAKVGIDRSFHNQAVAMTAHLRLNEQQTRAYELAILRGVSIYLAGAGGTGKTHTTKLILERLFRMRLGCSITAFTGTAARRASASDVRLRGHTLHSLFNLRSVERNPERSKHYIDARKPGVQVPAAEILEEEDTNTPLQEGEHWTAYLTNLCFERLSKTHVLCIDEISMVSADLFEVIDTTLRFVKRRPNVPFGGVQLLVLGDFAQLPPIKPRERSDEAVFTFQLPIWKRAPFPTILTTVIRQSDEATVRLLNSARDGKITTQECNELMANSYKGSRKPKITLVAKRVPCKEINKHEYDQLQGAESTYHPSTTLIVIDRTNSPPIATSRTGAHTYGLHNHFSFPWVNPLSLKVGTRVQCTRNVYAYDKDDHHNQPLPPSTASPSDPDIPDSVPIDAANVHSTSLYTVAIPNRILSNGMLGTVVSIGGESPIVKWDDLPNQPAAQVPTVWRSKKQRQKCTCFHDGPHDVICKTGYLPLDYAWAITFHKSQGATLTGRVDIATKSWPGCFGAGYTAISRCTNLSNVRFINGNPRPCDFECHPKVQEYHRTLFPREEEEEEEEGEWWDMEFL